jgi:hypothetical protein
MMPRSAWSARASSSYPRLDPIGVSKIVLGEIAMQVFLTAMLIDAHHAAPKDGKEALSGVHAGGNAGHAISVSVFLSTTIDSAVSRESLADTDVLPCLIGHKMRLFGDIFQHDRGDVRGRSAIDTERTRLSSSLNQRQNNAFVRRTAAFGRALALANEGLIGLHECASATHGFKPAVAHRFSDTMANEPSSLEIDAENSGELIGAEAFLAAAKQVHSLKPNVHWHMTFFKDSPDFDGEWLAAGVALISANPSALAFERATLIYNAAMWTRAPVSPDDGFNISGLLRDQHPHLRGELPCGAHRYG